MVTNSPLRPACHRPTTSALRVKWRLMMTCQSTDGIQGSQTPYQMPESLLVPEAAALLPVGYHGTLSQRTEARPWSPGNLPCGSIVCRSARHMGQLGADLSLTALETGTQNQGTGRLVSGATSPLDLGRPSSHCVLLWLLLHVHSWHLVLLMDRLVSCCIEPHPQESKLPHVLKEPACRWSRWRWGPLT